MVVPKNKKAYTKKLVAQLLKKNHTSRVTVDVIAGGVTRRESAELAMSHLLLKSDAPRYIMFHDASRPLIHPSMISSVFRAVKRVDGAVVGRTMLDLCTYAENYFVTDVLQKGYTLQTPQCYVFKKLYRAYEEIKKNPNARMFNDGTAIMKEVYPNAKIKIVITNALNLKLTHVEDGATVKKLL